MDDFSDYHGPAWVVPFFVQLRIHGKVAPAAASVNRAPTTIYDRKRDCARFRREWYAVMKGDGRPDKSAATPAKAMRVNTGNKRKRFLEALAETSNVKRSAKLAGLDLAKAYKLRRGDPAFAAQWRAALAEGYEHLEMEVLAFLRGNDPRRKLDIPNAIRLLTAHRKTVAEFRAAQEPDDEREVLAAIDDMIDRMRREATAEAAAEAPVDVEESCDGERG